MYLLYLDESGTHRDARHFVLAGVVVHESNLYWIKERVDSLQSKYFPAIQDPVKFHATTLRMPDADLHRIAPPFNGLSELERSGLLLDLYQIVYEVRGTFFAVVIDKTYLDASQDPYERALNKSCLASTTS